MNDEDNRVSKPTATDFDKGLRWRLSAKLIPTKEDAECDVVTKRVSSRAVAWRNITEHEKKK